VWAWPCECRVGLHRGGLEEALPPALVPLSYSSVMFLRMRSLGDMVASSTLFLEDIFFLPDMVEQVATRNKRDQTR
jgi:hypothetical protein